MKRLNKTESPIFVLLLALCNQKAAFFKFIFYMMFIFPAFCQNVLIAFYCNIVVHALLIRITSYDSRSKSPHGGGYGIKRRLSNDTLICYEDTMRTNTMRTKLSAGSDIKL